MNPNATREMDMMRPLESMADLGSLGNGVVDTMVVANLQRLIRDCASRPADKSIRELTIKVRVRPKLTQTGQFDSVVMGVNVAAKVPNERFDDVVVGINRATSGVLFDGRVQTTMPGVPSGASVLKPGETLTRDGEVISGGD